jgi:hypothetical protein
VHGRDAVLRVAARTEGADHSSLVDHVALGHRDRLEMEERDGVAVRREDRDAAAVDRDGARERDGAGGGTADGRAGIAADVDAAVLPGRVAIRAELERAENRSVGGP